MTININSEIAWFVLGLVSIVLVGGSSSINNMWFSILSGGLLGIWLSWTANILFFNE